MWHLLTFVVPKGIDGFRVDTVNMYSKNPSFADAPVTDVSAAWQEAGLVYCNGPRMNEYVYLLYRRIIAEDTLTID